MNRRRFISKTALSSAGLGLSAMVMPGALTSVASPNDMLNVGLIGCRNMGFGILKHHLSNPGIRCIALCDIDEAILNERVADYSFTEGKESHGEHVRNFLGCIRNGNKLACPPETARNAALHLHIPNIAARTGEAVLIWDDANNRFTNSETANKLIEPVYRTPWTLPKF